MKILSVFGTRPEAIKMAPVVQELNGLSGVDARVCVTGQHREMLDQVLSWFEIKPAYDLDVMRPGQGLSDLTAAVLVGLNPVLQVFRPDAVVVHGDTTSTLAASLAAYYARIPVAHVEAGLRTDDLWSPWPEEGNRRLVGALAHWHFAPTVRARDQLLAENVVASRIFVTGNTVIDALQQTCQRLDASAALRAEAHAQLPANVLDRPFVLVTGHRRENFGDGFDRICAALARLAVEFPEVNFVYPVHLNPNVREPVHRRLGEVGNVWLMEPLDYLPFVELLRHCELVLTDSGGLQEEAPALGKPVLVMRNTTERPEALESGTAKLVGTDPDRIVAETCTLLRDRAAYSKMARAHNPFGDGQAARRIAQILALR